MKIITKGLFSLIFFLLLSVIYAKGAAACVVTFFPTVGPGPVGSFSPDQKFQVTITKCLLTAHYKIFLNGVEVKTSYSIPPGNECSALQSRVIKTTIGGPSAFPAEGEYTLEARGSTYAGSDSCTALGKITIKGSSGFGPTFCGDGIKTAIGCIPIKDFGDFAMFFLKYLLGIAGVVAFFLIIIAGFQILTSAGNPEKLEGAKQLLTAAIVGALFIIFSVVLLQIIGVELLWKPPGFPTFF